MTTLLDHRATEAQWLALTRPLYAGETAKVINPAGAQYPDLVKYGTGAMFSATPYAVTTGGGGSDTPQVIAASTVIPLNGNFVMADVAYPDGTVFQRGTLAFDGVCAFGITAVGGATYDLSALGPLSGDAISSTAGDLNRLVAYNGYGNRTEISNRVFPTTTVPGDTTPPTINARSVANGTPTVVNLTFTEAMDVTSVPAPGAFTVSGKTVSAFAFVDSTHANVTVSVAFANGVTSTLAYTQPSTGKLKDSAGNLLAAFTGAAIVNNVAAPGDTSPPTITTRAVQNGTPSVLNLTFSEAMKTSVVPPASAFTVGGHTVSAFAWVDTTHANLTLATPFVNGEAARTLAYVVPGNLQTQDVAGNWLDAFSGAAIVNNVAATGGAPITANFTQADGPLGAPFESHNGATFKTEGNQALVDTQKTAGFIGGVRRQCNSANGVFEIDFILNQYLSGVGHLLRVVDDNNYLCYKVFPDYVQVVSVTAGDAVSVKSVNGTYSHSTLTHAKATLAGSNITIVIPGGPDIVLAAADFTGSSAHTSGTKFGMTDQIGLHDNFSFVPA
jgi:hypothetical protein